MDNGVLPQTITLVFFHNIFTNEDTKTLCI